MRNAPGFSMPKETPRRLLTPLKKVQSQHDALSLSSPAPTVRVPDPAFGSDSYLVFNATLAIPLFLLCAKHAVSQTPFLRSPTTLRKSEESGDAQTLSLIKHSVRECARSPHTPLRHFAAVPLPVRPQPGDLASLGQATA
ncbi:unnamed protein product [Sphagnum jensenii]|jgi:hypothetical protein